MTNGNTTHGSNSQVGKPLRDKYQIRHVTTELGQCRLINKSDY